MAIKRSKRYEAAAKLVEKNKAYAWAEAVKILKQIPATKGDQTIDLAFKRLEDPVEVSPDLLDVAIVDRGELLGQQLVDACIDGCLVGDLAGPLAKLVDVCGSCWKG